jgi:hypothetical protein
LKRLAPSLKLIGLEVEFGQRESGTGRRMITVRHRDVGDSSESELSHDAPQLSQEGATVTQKRDQRDSRDSRDSSNAFLSTYEGKSEKRGKNGKQGHEIEGVGPGLSRLSPKAKSSPPIDPDDARKIFGNPIPKSETP